jgi:hypothetical protein
MMRTFLNTAPGDVISMTAVAGSTPRSCLRSMNPFFPNDGIRAPVLASTA